MGLNQGTTAASKASPPPSAVRPAPLSRVAESLLIACWWGLVAGVGYAAVMLFRQLVQGRIAWVSRDVIWMAPLAHVVLFVPLALLIALVTLPFRASVGRAFAIVTLGFLALFSLLLPFGQLARWASALMALGVAMQASRLYAAAPSRWRRRAGWSAAALAGLVMVVSVGQRTWLGLGRRAAIATLPPAAAGAPNVLLVIWDTVRGADLGLYGYSRPTTPALERWAADGVVFDWAMATTSWSLPSHAAIFTGLLGSQTGGDWRHPIQTQAPTLAEALRDRGYRTAGFVGNLIYTTYESGLTRGFIDYHDYPVSLNQTLLHNPLFQTRTVTDLIAPGWERTPSQGWLDLRLVRLPPNDHKWASSITDDFLAWQAGRGGRPFFAFLNYMDAHGPHYAPAAFHARFGDSTQKVNRYDAAIAYLDTELDRLLGELQRRGVLDHTIVVVTADHGLLLGAHNIVGHAKSLYSKTLRVPLLIRYPPAVPRGRRIETTVSLRDLAATILDLAGIRKHPTLPGSSLAGAWTEGGSWKPTPVVSELIQGEFPNSGDPNALTWLESVMDDSLQYIRDGTGNEALYAYRHDLPEEEDLAGTAEGRRAIARFRRALETVYADR